MNNTKKAIYPGTFDPLTLGHLDIVKRALKMFDEITIAVALSSEKKPLFSLEERVSMAKECFKNDARIKVESYDNLLVDFAAHKDILNIIRGLRAISDFEYELQLGYANQSLNPNIETVYLMPSLEYAFISSSVVRSILKHGGNASHLLPSEVSSFIEGKNFVCCI
ncbi:MAG: pantetheine-phosphate adenylyltransferase [Campylobacteraceae bacterium]|jgi:pantetheine-phosphate adenylyltransferase|nr:pantetheine-phosphate adenylyltransferase [Campylobacteraceae bacterium]